MLPSALPVPLEWPAELKRLAIAAQRCAGGGAPLFLPLPPLLRPPSPLVLPRAGGRNAAGGGAAGGGGAAEHSSGGGEDGEGDGAAAPAPEVPPSGIPAESAPPGMNPWLYQNIPWERNMGPKKLHEARPYPC